MSHLLITSLVLLSVFADASLHADEPTLKPRSEVSLTPAELQADLAVARGAMEESHAGLYWHITKEELGRVFDRTASSLEKPMTVREFYALLLPVVAGVRHGHTTLTAPIDSVGYRLRELSKAGSYFPFGLRIIDEKVHVLTNLSEDPAISTGAEIVSINGRPTAEIVARMLTCVSADGSNLTFKYYLLGLYKFHALLDLLYGPSASYSLEYLPPDAQKALTSEVSSLAPGRMAEIHAERTGKTIDFFEKPLRFEISADGQSAVLTVTSFYRGFIESQGLNYESFLQDSFAELARRKIKRLILDLRNNEGGSADDATLLYTYLADRPFRLNSPTELASDRTTYFGYADQLSEDLTQFRAAPANFVTSPSPGIFLLKEEHDEESHKSYEPNPHAFTGELYVLTNGGSFSATNSVLDLLYHYHREKGPVGRLCGRAKRRRHRLWQSVRRAKPRDCAPEQQTAPLDSDVRRSVPFAEGFQRGKDSRSPDSANGKGSRQWRRCGAGIREGARPEAAATGRRALTGLAVC
jgi:hypothetical protein